MSLGHYETTLLYTNKSINGGSEGQTFIRQTEK